jgi:UDP-2,4-diacetamido-2,4,6-trideoxy-beta-L-altropyranose hydrolase
MEQHLLIRVDASTEIGTGHLMRCLALAQAWKDAGNKVAFITNCQSEGLLQRLRGEEFSLYALAGSHPDPKDWNYTKEVLASYPNAWVVLDNYYFDETYQQRVKESGHRLLVIDDMAHLKHYYADIVLNQNLHAEQLHYSCEPYTRLLLGTRYVLLRREFLAWRGWKREIPEIARHLLVTLGGSDSENHTLKVIQALQKVDVTGLEATVVIGAGNLHTDELEAAVRQSQVPIQLVRDARNMPELMSWADVAISSAGSTVWELLFLGTPTLALILADNQRQIAEEVERQGVARNLGRAENLSVQSLAKQLVLMANDSNLRRKISKNARQLVDGQGAQRVVASIEEGRALGLSLRPVRQKDCRLLWEWANDPVVRENSFNSTPVQWNEHQNWFRQKLADPRCFIYIITGEEGVPLGQVRFDINPDGIAEVDISTDVKERNKGYGSTALKLACQYILGKSNTTKVLAHIKEDNEASIRVFTKAGFANKGLKNFKGHKTIEMVWR